MWGFDSLGAVVTEVVRGINGDCAFLKLDGDAPDHVRRVLCSRVTAAC